MSIVTAERTDEVAAREAAAGQHATLAREAESAAATASGHASTCAGIGDAEMASAWAKIAVEAAGTALGHAHRAREAHPGSLEERAAMGTAKRAQRHAEQAISVARRD